MYENIYEILLFAGFNLSEKTTLCYFCQNPYITQVGVLGIVLENSESNKMAFSDMEGKQFQVIIQDGNGNYLLVENSFCPLKFLAELIQGKNTSDLAGY